MHTINILNSFPIRPSPRIAVLKAMMDYPDEATTEFGVKLEIDLPESWQVGLIVGPSGSGKSTIARNLFGEFENPTWDEEKPVFDNFSLLPSETAELLFSVGLSSVPTWLRPRQLLSGGEGFRADVARMLERADAQRPTVIDEFTSVVDRQVAKAISVCTAKHARRSCVKVVCVACHYDILDWLQPDWVIDMNDRRYYRRSLRRRPVIELDVGEISAHKAWPIFKPHHYMRGPQSFSVRAWGAFLDGRPIAYSSYGILPHPKIKNIMMGSRLVVLPDFQGLGVGKALENWVAELLARAGYRVRNRTAHPGAQAIYEKDPRWRLADIGRTSPGTTTNSSARSGVQRRLCMRVTRAYEFVL